MRPDIIVWDDADDPGGNVEHIAAADLTLDEVEEALNNPDAPPVRSEGSPADMDRWIVFGWTSTGRHIAVVYTIEAELPDLVVYPVTAYDVPEYGEGN